MDQALDGIRAKLDRAEEHLNVLDDEIAGYLRGNPYRFVAEEHTEGDYHHFAIFLEVEEFPPDHTWGPIIGDAVHNLRSALDHLAWQLALDSARQQTPRRIEFPIFLDDPTNDAEIRGTFTKKLNCLRPEAHAVIEGAQPYKTGDSHHPLWLLQALWNTDKHRTLHTAGFLFGTPSDGDSGAFGYDGWSFGRFLREGDAENRTPLSRGRSITPQDVQVHVNAYENLAVDVSLGQIGDLPVLRDEPYSGLPIRQVLRRIQTYIVGEILAPLEPLVV